MKRILYAALLLASAVQASTGHVHGEGRLDVVIDGGQITLVLELPLDAAVGFERAPKSDAEKAALAAAVQTLDDPALFLPTAAAKCTAQPVERSMPAIDGKGGPAHADITATYRFRCATPAALKGIETGLFKRFKRLYRLDTRRVSPLGQGAMRLTPKQPLLSW